MQNILVTGFEPFGGDAVNPSWEAVRRLPDEIGGFAIEKLLLPVSFERTAALAEEAVLQKNPAAVLCVGQAGGRPNITVEKIGINRMDASIADNDGFTPHDEPLAADGRDAYFSTLPVSEMVQAVRRAGVPAQLSLSAGNYVCNSLLYGLMHRLDARGLQRPTGFIHVPFIPQQVLERNYPSMTLEQIITALTAALEVIAANL